MRTLIMLMALALPLACAEDKSDADKSHIPAPSRGPAPGDATPEEGAAPAPSTPAACEAAWTAYVAAHPAGLVMGYELRIKSTGLGTDGQRSRSRTTETVTASDTTAVKTDRVYQPLEPEESAPTTASATTTKEDYLEACANPAAGIAPSGTDYDVKIVLDKRERITVRAGAFDTRHLKIRVTGGDGSYEHATTVETWTIADGGVLARSLVKGTVSAGRMRQAQTSETELVRLEKP